MATATEHKKEVTNMTNYPDEQTIESLRQEYPEGTVVILDKMNDVHAPEVGTAGEVYFVDAIGTIHVNWLSGSDLGVAYGEDELHKANEHEAALYKIGKVAKNQRQNPDGQHFCPRCGEEMDGVYRHAVSRNADVIICDACGQAEAIEDLIKAGYVKGKSPANRRVGVCKRSLSQFQAAVSYPRRRICGGWNITIPETGATGHCDDISDIMDVGEKLKG